MLALKDLLVLQVLRYFKSENKVSSTLILTETTSSLSNASTVLEALFDSCCRTYSHDVVRTNYIY